MNQVVCHASKLAACLGIAVVWGCGSETAAPAGGGRSPPSAGGASTSGGIAASTGETVGVGGTFNAGGSSSTGSSSGAVGAGGSSGVGATLTGSGGMPTGTGAMPGGVGGMPGGAGGALGGSGGTPGGSGGGPVDDAVEELLAQFVAYWDFEVVFGSTVLPRVGSAPLELAGATVAAGTNGAELVTSGVGTTAMTDAAVLDTSQDFSVSAWVKLDQLDGYDTFVGVDGKAVSAFFLQKRDNDRLSFATFASDATSTAACVATGEIRPREGEWYFVVGAYSASTGQQRIYVDGVLAGQTTCAAGVFQAAGGLSVGRGLYDGAASDPWSGALDDLGLIARVLTPSEITAL